MKIIYATIFLLLPLANFSQNLITSFPEPNKNCLSCHEGIEPIRDHNSKMMQEIYEEGIKMNDPNGCVVCHYGNPEEENNKDKAHKDMIIHPGSLWTLDRTCGKCHDDHSYNMHRNLMETEAGKIQGAIWGWGAPDGYKSLYGNYNIDDPDGPEPRWGTDEYKKYMTRLQDHFPNVYVTSLEELPEADIYSISEHPEQAVLTYLRGDCQRCHVGVQGKQRRGDYRGMGCAACHIPYSDEGLYEGGDPSISKDKPGHLLVHSIQSSRKTKVKVNDITYSGIPSETCTSCHNRGKRIGVSYLGLIESPYDTPWQADGSPQPKMHGKQYQYIEDDAHHRATDMNGEESGMLCQDCHTSLSQHGNGNLATTTLAEVEVECADCHGTIEKYPWELPLGYQDEYGLVPYTEARGLTNELLNFQKDFSTVYDPEDGYLLTARGNPFGNVVRQGNDIIVHSASGSDFKSPVLKSMAKENSWKNPEEAMTSMAQVPVHMEKMECYTCHSTWAPQCYGCHVKVDYSEGSHTGDWLASGKVRYANGETLESMGEMIQQPGKLSESRTQVIWEDPVLGINGEGRVTPIIPGCQQITTVIGPDGEVIVSNKIWDTPPFLENSGEKGQRGIDMSPTTPHTTSAKARTCVSCHANPKALGYGIGDGEYMKGYEVPRYNDIQDASGQQLSKNSQPQLGAIPNLPMDLSQVVTRDGKQLQTVGHHWPLSGPLTQEMREHMERAGTCIACHQDLPDGDAAIKMITTAGDLVDMVPHSDEEHAKLLNQDINWAARTRLIAPVILIVFGLLIYVIWRQRRKLKLLR